MNAKANIAAVVVSYEALPFLTACLHSLEQVAEISDIVVVDNASSDGTADWLRTCPANIRVIANERNLGFAAAVNQGCQATTAPYLLLLNCDVEVPVGAIAPLLAFLLSQDRAAAACARLLTPAGHEQLRVRNQRRPIALRWAPAAALLLRRQALEQVGWFDPLFFFYNEDIDLGIRLRRAGWQIYLVPNSWVIHHEGKSTDRIRHETIVHGYRGGLYLIKKHYAWALPLARMGIHLEVHLRALVYRFLPRRTAKQQAFLAAFPALCREL
ncbi:MAG: glycosyltransferase family 2 protein [Cyanobacteria bacterium NC_groundwater_1444_Ag_S-0.65um_54_12]|nr:glycosyltransferase family 2 protein [Cyanobacteria bacterium NC_groundwater_1444_Ag_S-0.65um_54_12]